MMIESIPAIPAASGANIAQTNTILATDGAPISTDAQNGHVAAFAAVFDRLSQPTAVEEIPPQVEAVAAQDLPRLQNLPPLQETVLPLDADVEPEDLESDKAPQKPQISAVPVAISIQPLEIAKSPPKEERYPAVEQNIRRPQPMPAEATPPKKQKQVEGNFEAVEIPQQVAEQMPLPQNDAPDRRKIDPVKPEFTLLQPHMVQKEIDPPAPPLTLPPEQTFIQTNHPKILTAIHGELLPNGGSMHIRLDPPELGALAVQIDVRDGIVTASFQTSNDEATRLLSHSLSRLRTTLESAGVSVEKLQVQQAPREQFNSASQERDQRERGPQQQAYERSAHDDQQRREMLQRMWRRLVVGRDMLDLIA